MIDKRFKFSKWMMPLLFIAMALYYAGSNSAVGRSEARKATDGDATIFPSLSPLDSKDYTIKRNEPVLLEDVNEDTVFYSWFYTSRSRQLTKDEENEGIESGVTVKNPQSDGGVLTFEVVQVVQLWKANSRGVLKVVAESTTPLDCGLRTPGMSANTVHDVSEHVEFVEIKGESGDPEWSLSLIGNVGIGCKSIDLNVEIHDLYQEVDPNADLYICGSREGVCSIPVTNVFVKTEADVNIEGPLFSCGPIRFFIKRNNIVPAGEPAGEMEMHLQINDFFTKSSLSIGVRNPIKYLEISQGNDGEFTHIVNEESVPPLAESATPPQTAFTSRPIHTTPIDGHEVSIDYQYDMYFGYDPSTGDYLTNGTLRNSIFDPYSSCAGCFGH